MIALRVTRRGLHQAANLVSVLVVIGLVSVVVPKFISHGPIRPGQETRFGLERLRGLLLTFRLDTNRFPSTKEGLAVLLVHPPNTPSWRGPYIKELPRDEWGRSYRYEGARTGKDEYRVYSAGLDGRFGTPDDLSEMESIDGVAERPQPKP